jgi:hypothetical protein
MYQTSQFRVKKTKKGFPVTPEKPSAQDDHAMQAI